MKLKTQVSLAVLAILSVSLFAFENCSSGSSGSGVTANSVIAAQSAYSELGVGMTDTLTLTGGTPPYTLAIASGGGTVTPTTQSSTATYLAPSSGSGTVVIDVTDAAGNMSTISIVLSGTSASLANTTNSALTISPINPSVAVNGEVTFSVVGGSGVYSYSVLTVGGGSFSGSTFIAADVNETVTVNVTDSLGNVVQTSVYVGTAGTVSSTTYPVTTTPIKCSTTHSPSCGNGTNTYWFKTDASGNPYVRISRTGYSAMDTGWIPGTTYQYDEPNGNCSYTQTIAVTPTELEGTYTGGGNGQDPGGSCFGTMP